MDSEFEKKLRRQPVKEISSAWRAEILAAARAEQPIRHSSFAIRPGWFSTLNSQLSTFFWPHPRAWAGLAAVWVIVFMLNFSMREKSPVMAGKSVPPSPEFIVELRKQKLLFAELLGAGELRVADRPKIFSPKPSSERAEFLAG